VLARLAAERGLLARTVLVLAGVALGLRLLSFGTLRSAARSLSRLMASGEPDRVAWAVRAAGRRIPGARGCLPQALAGLALLEGAELRIGVTRENGAIAAHAWLEHGGRVVVGRLPDLDRFRAFQ
jgi:hypothetical protein